MKIQNAVLFYVITVLVICKALTCSAANATDEKMSVSMGDMDKKDGEFVMYSDQNCSYARVRRGRDWNRGEQDGGKGSLGTVMEMLIVDGKIVEGICWVLWDSEKRWMYAYSVGLNGIFSLYTVNENIACPVYDNKKCPYTRVKRGPDWMAGNKQNQDGGVGNLGTIVGIIEKDNVFCKVIWDGYNGIQYPYPIGIEGKSYLCTVEADDNDVNAFVDGFDVDAFIESIFYWRAGDVFNADEISTEDIFVGRKNLTDQVNTATVLQLETLCILLVVWTTVCNM